MVDNTIVSVKSDVLEGSKGNAERLYVLAALATAESEKREKRRRCRLSVQEMRRLLLEYGPEVTYREWSDSRLNSITERSLRRLFDKTNPNFDIFFRYQGRWTPVLGKEDELKRRTECRKRALLKRKASTEAKKGKSFDYPRSFIA